MGRHWGSIDGTCGAYRSAISNPTSAAPDSGSMRETIWNPARKSETVRISTLATQICPKSRSKSRRGLGLIRDSTSRSSRPAVAPQAASMYGRRRRAPPRAPPPRPSRERSVPGTEPRLRACIGIARPQPDRDTRGHHGRRTKRYLCGSGYGTATQCHGHG